MSHHEGVSCDSCLKNNFRGKRYKCLICFDYDLCATCHDSGTTNGRHTAEHPMQCILTRNDLDLYFAGEVIEQPHSFTCPFCGKLGFTDATLYDHVNVSHNDSTTQVVCPICATLPGGEPNQITDDFLTHLCVEHQPHIVRIRSRHHPRGLNNNRSRRSQFLNPGGASSASTSAREAIDPIAQLLSQLSDVRRVNSTNPTSGPSGMMQLQFERQSHANRLPLERIIRRHQQSSQAPSSSALASAHSESIVSAGNPQMPYMVLLDPTTTSPAVNASVHSKSNSTGGTQLNKISTKYLLSTTTTMPLVDSEREKLGTLRADRSIFVEEMILASLAEPLSIETILSSNPSTDEVKVASNSDPSLALDQTTNSEIKMVKEEEEEAGEEEKVVESEKESEEEFPHSDAKENTFVDNLHPTSAPKALVDGNNAAKEATPATPAVAPDGKPVIARKPSIKSLENNLNSKNYSEHEPSVQQKPLPSFAANPPNTPYIMASQAQKSSITRSQKARAAPSMGSSTATSRPANLASLAIRSSLTSHPGLTVVSPTGRRKVHKHSTEPPPN